MIRAIRFRLYPPQHGLEPLNIAGNPEYRVDPTSDDFYRRLVDLRGSVQAAAEEAEASGDDEQAARLDGEQQALKLTANATSYGCFIELNPKELSEPQLTLAYGLDGEAFPTSGPRHEQPGRDADEALTSATASRSRPTDSSTLRRRSPRGRSP